MLYVISTWCLKFCLLVLNQLPKLDHCLIQCCRKFKSGNYLPKQAPGYFWCSFSPRRKSFYPFQERTYHDQQVMVVSVRFHFSEVHFQVFKGVPCGWIPRGFCLCQRQHWPVSRQCSSEILSCIGKRGEEPRNIFELALPVYHCPGGSLGVFGLSEWVPAPPVPIIYHLAIPTIPFQSWWLLLLWLVGFGASVYFGESSISSGSSTNTRALIGASLVTSKPLAACLAVLSASLFPRARGVSSFWCPWQCMTATLSGSQVAANGS